MNKCDIICVCSYGEAFGLTTIEAMLSGALVVASDSGANSELIQDKINGLLFKCDDCLELSDKLFSSIKEKHFSREISRQGQNSSSFYSLINSVNELEDCFRS